MYSPNDQITFHIAGGLTPLASDSETYHSNREGVFAVLVVYCRTDLPLIVIRCHPWLRVGPSSVVSSTLGGRELRLVGRGKVASPIPTLGACRSRVWGRSCCEIDRHLLKHASHCLRTLDAIIVSSDKSQEPVPRGEWMGHQPSCTTCSNTQILEKAPIYAWTSRH